MIVQNQKWLPDESIRLFSNGFRDNVFHKNVSLHAEKVVSTKNPIDI
jgi:hypothetical protein